MSVVLDALAPPWRSTVMEIDPEFAASVLADSNAANRPLSENHARRLADSMLSGDWRLTPQGIVFSTDNMLLDGQHRLRAVVIAGVTVPMHVTYDVSSETFAAFDNIVKPRSGGDAIGVYANIGKYRGAIATGLRLVANYEKGRFRGTGSQLSNLQIVALFNQWPDMEHYARVAQWLGTNSGVNRSACLAGLVMTAAANPSLDQGEWLAGVGAGVGLSVGDPRLALRRFGTKHPARNRSSEALPRYIKAWNAWAQGREIREIRLQQSEQFVEVARLNDQRDGDKLAFDSIVHHLS